MATPQYSTLPASASAFAARAHEGQLRTGTRFPYLVHPLGVGHILREHYPNNPLLEAAGYLHDTIEDVKWVTYMTLVEKFGERVAWLVDSVTRRPPNWRGGPDGSVTWSLEERMRDPDVARLKAADVLDNVRDSIRGLQKGHDVWSRFHAGRRKADYWWTVSDVVGTVIPGEPLAADLRTAILFVGDIDHRGYIKIVDSEGPCLMG